MSIYEFVFDVLICFFFYFVEFKLKIIYLVIFC